MLETATPVPAKSVERVRPQPGPIMQGLKALASLKLTVALLGLSVFLVFIGTVAQIEGGIWTIVRDYFRSFFVLIPFQLFVKLGQIFLSFPADMRIPGAFPYPGGWTLGGLLLINLVAAHLVRFKLSWRRTGILMLHTGIMILMIGELITGLFQIESRMTIGPNETVNFIEDTRAVELAVIDTSSPKEIIEICIPQSMLQASAKSKLPIRHAELPFEVEVQEWMTNSELTPMKKGLPTHDVFNSAMGVPFSFFQVDEVSGVDSSQHEDAVSARIRIKEKGTDRVIAQELVSLWFSPNFTRRIPIYRFAPIQVAIDGKTYELALRGRRDYLPLSLTLKEFRFDRYPGTNTPKNYSSLVQLKEGGSQGRDVLIRMNEPLTTHGQTMYQSGFTPDEKGTVLHVTRNPGVWMPYIACSLVALGMVWHFGLVLVGFLQKQGVV